MSGEYQQKLMDEVYKKWQTKECESMNRLEVIKKYFTPLHKMAVQLGNMNYQVNNGGWSQWQFNGYDEDLDDLIEYVKKGTKLNLQSFKAIFEILTNIVALGEPSDYNDTEECECSYCGGSGYIYEYDDEDNEIEVECPECGGEGSWEEDIDGEERYCELLSEFDDKYYELNEDQVFADFETLLINFDNVKDMDISDVKFQSSIKPKCKLTGTDGNIFSVIGKVSSCLKQAGMSDKAEEYVNRATKSHSYDEALGVAFDYVDVL